MTKKSNLYIEKIYRDYPISCWALDDEVSYRQLLSGNALDWDNDAGGYIDYWGETMVSPVIEDAMFEKVIVSNNTTLFYIGSLNTLVLDPTKTDSVFSCYIYHPSPLIQKYEIGIIVDSVEYFSEFAFQEKTGWKSIYDVFPSSMLLDPTAQLYIKIYPLQEGFSNFELYMNAPSLGQDCEEYFSYSMGYRPEDLFVDEYGKNTENNGTYHVNEYGDALVSTGGIPLAYGSYQSLSIKKSVVGGPSISFPGSGFLHNNGKYSDYTLEMWVRLINSSVYPVKIFGSTSSTDGIYVEEGFISVYIGPYTQSYFVGKWYRPMLLHFQYSPKIVSLYINGEKVISIDIDVEKISFNDQEDRIGIYGSDLVDPYEVDSIALYPYLMPSEMAKKHFVYGQGVQDFDFSNDKFLKRTIQIDFPYSEYSYNLIYPDTNKWRSGDSVNLETSSSYIKPTEYRLPEIVCQSSSGFINGETWLLDNFLKNQSSPDVAPYFELSPTADYIESSIYFKNASVLNNKVKCVFGVFKSPEVLDFYQEIIIIENINTGESFRIWLSGTSLMYVYRSYQGDGDLLFHSEEISAGEYFYAGIDFSKITIDWYEQVGLFFSDPSKLSVTIGGSDTGKFLGRIFSINFIDSEIYNRHFSDGTRFTNGFINQDTTSPSLIGYIGNYSLIPLFSNTSMIMDIATIGYWDDYLPLSMFGKNIYTQTGTSYDLDFIQFNIDSQYEKIDTLSEYIPYSIFQSLISSYYSNYSEINAAYASYAAMVSDISSIYSSISPKTGVTAHIALQHFSQVGNKLQSDYVNVIPAAANNVVEINPLTLDNTKYEVYDNYTVLIPKEINFEEYYIAIYLTVSVRGTKTKNAIIKRMELSSMVFNDGKETKIGTKYSIPMYPFSEVIP